ncbi:MAG: filamentous hemagglutinin N-terminal domain-containing protein [Sporomusaceae bacterium]|nr:filamentous hemagglutinin N-terminal domain-containing protein [Sporomusaceae bacterium]
MKIQRKWRRAWLRGKPHWAVRKRPIAGIVDIVQRRSCLQPRLRTAVRKTAAAVTLAAMLGQQPLVFANQIITDGKTATSVTDQTQSVIDISTATHSAGGKIGFNSFSKFDVNTGKTVNLQLGAADSLINMVSGSSRSEIYGTLNSIKDNVIGGNVYFLNPHGLLVGAGGVVNVGSFTAMTPTPGSISFFDGSNLDAWGAQIVNGALPANPAGKITIQGRINAISDIKLTAGAVEHVGALYSRAYFTAASPQFEDVVNHNGLSSGTKYAVTNDGKIQIVAEKVNLQTGSLITAKGYEGATDGDISITATDAGSLDNGIFSHGAAVSMDGAVLSGKDITINATTAYTDDALLGITVHNASAVIDVKDSTINASGNVSMKADVDIDVNAKTPSFMAKLTGDSAFAGALVNSTSRVKLDGTTDIQAGGDVSLAANNTVKLNVFAQAADNEGGTGQLNGGNNAGGASLGFAIIRSTTEAGITGQASISTSGAIDIKAESENKATTTAISSIKGAQMADETSEIQKKLTEYQDDAQTSEGNITAVAALGINAISSVTKAYMDSSAASHSSGNAAVTSRAVNQSAVTADGSAVEAGATGIGVAVGINKVSSDNQAYVNQEIAAKALSVKSAGNGTDAHSLTTKVSSGAGAADVGVAGALAVNVHVNESLAQIGGLGNIQAETVSVTAENESNSTASSLPSGAASGSKVGVGASVATNIGINHVTAEIADNAKFRGAKDINLEATGKHSLTTEAKAGSKGGISVMPVVAVTVADNQATARIGTGDTLAISGDLTVKADNTGSATTKAEGQADGEKAAIGAAIAITVAVDQAEAMTARDIDADGKVSFQADNAGASETTAIASAAGGKAAKEDGTAQDGEKNVDEQNAEQLEKVSGKKGADGTSISDKTSDQAKTALKADNAPKAETSEGSVSVAAAVGVNTGIATAKAYTADNVDITAGGALALKTTNNATATAKADGAAVGKDGADPAKVGIGAAVAVNVANANNQATLGKGTHQVGSLDISATMRDIGEADKTSIFGAEAASGAGGSSVGIAGSVAVNVVDNSSIASITGGADVTVTGGDVSLTAENNSESTAKALPHEDTGVTGGKLGVGASVATNIGVNHVTAEIADGAKLSGSINDVNLSATGKHSLTTEAKAGSKGGVSVTPVVAVTVADNQATARIGSGDTLDISGDLTVKADNTGSATTKAEGQADGEKAAIGAAVAITVAVDQAEAMTDRDIDAGGSVSFQADNAGASETTAIASSAGGKAAKEDGTAQDGEKSVDDKNAEQLDKVNETKGADGKSIGDKTSDQAKTALKPDNAPKAETSEGSVSVAAAVGVNTGIATAKAYTADGVDITAGDTLALKTSNNATATAKADGAAVGKDGADPAKVGIGAAVAVNVASAGNQATLGKGTHTAGSLDISATMRDVGESGKADTTSTFGVEAASGAGGSSVGIAGSVAVNVVDNSSIASITGGADVTVTGGDISLTAENNSESTAKALPHEDTGVTGGKLGVGASVATNIGINHVTAEIADGVKLSGSINDISLSAVGKHSLATEAKAGSKGGVSVTPVVAVTVDDNQATARIGTGDLLTLTGDLTVKADNTGTATTRAEGQADGEKAAIGAAISITVAVDQAEAMTDRSLTAGGGVSFQADNVGASETVAIASAAGGKAAKANGDASEGDKEVNDKTAEQLEKVGDTKGADGGSIGDKTSDQAKTALNANNAPKAETSEGSVSVAAAVGINTGIASAKAYTADNVNITAGDTLALKTGNNAAATAKADGAAVGKDGADPAKVGIGAAVAVNTASVNNQATLGTGVHTVGGLDISAVMRDIGAGDRTSTFSAEASSGAGAAEVGIAGSVAVNVVDNSSTAGISGGADVTVNTGGDVSITAENNSESAAKAVPHENSTASGKSVGVGASVATNIGINHVTAEIADNAKLSGAKDVSLAATGKHTLATEAKAGSKGSVSVTPVVAVTVADNQATAKIGEGDTLTITGNLTVKADNTGSTTTRAEGQADGEKAAIGAAVAVTVAVDQAEAMTARNITAGDSVSFQADNAAASAATAIASAAGGKAAKDDGTVQAGEKTVDEQNAEQIEKAGQKKGADGKSVNDKASAEAKTALGKNNAPKAETNEGSVSVAAAVGVNVGTASAKAYTKDGANVTAGDKLSLKTSNNNTAAVEAEGKAVQANKDGNKVGVAAAVAINVANQTNIARLGAATHDVKGLEIAAVMRDTGTAGQPDTANNFTATATSGAGASKVGIAGSLALNVVNNTTGADITGGAAVNAGSGAVTLRAEQNSVSVAKALPAEKGASGGDAGIGASVAINVISDTTRASINDNAGLIDAGAVKVTAVADHDTTAEAKGGAAGGVAIDAVGAVTTLSQTTQAMIGKGSALSAASVEVESSGSGDHKAAATGDTESGSVGVGASAAVITSSSAVTATISRDIAANGSLCIKAAADRSYEAVASASAKGAKPLGDGEAAPSNPKNTSSKALNDTADKQKGTNGGKKVDVAAAVGVTVLNDDVQAGITGGSAAARRNINAGSINIAASNQSDFSSRGSGAALDPKAKAGIGVGVGISVALNETTASIGEYTAVKTGGDVAVKAESKQNMADDFVKKLAAEGVAGAGSDKVGVAGALAVAYTDSVTKASLGDHVSIDNDAAKAGDIAVTADNTGKLSAKAWSAAKGGSAGVGASVATIFSDNEHTASVGESGDIRANSLQVKAENHKVTGTVPFEYDTKDLAALKASLTDESLQSILGQNNYYTEAIAGAASSNVAVTGAAAVNYFQDKTTASVGSGTKVATTGGVEIAGQSDTTAKAFVTSVALSSGNAGVGLVSTNIINESETASTLDGEITESGSVSVTADSRQDIGAFGLGGGAANTGVSGVATVVVSKNTVSAQVADAAAIQTAGSLLVDAKNAVNTLNIAASLAVGGTAGVGAAAGTTNVRNDTLAWIGKNTTVQADQDVVVKAAASETLNTIAAGGAGGGTAGVAGSAVVETIQVSTKAFVDQGANLDVGKSVSISATDDTVIGSFGGAVSFGGTAGVGAGAVVEVIDKDTEASVKDSASSNKTTITAKQDVVVAANASENITAAAASAAGGGTAGVAGSGIVYVINNTTSGYIGDNAVVRATGNAAISAQNATTVNLLAGNVAIGGTAGVGGAAGVSVINKTIDAHIGKNAAVQVEGKGAAVQAANGQFVADTAYTPGENEIATPGTDNLDQDEADALAAVVAAMQPVKADTQAVSGVAVSAVSLDTVRSGSVGAAGGGTAGVQGSVSAVVTDNTTRAYIDRGADIQTGQSVLVAAGSDFHRLATAGAAAVGGNAGVGLGNDTSVRTANTEAYIARAAKVMAQKDIAVTANAAESIFSVAVAGAAGLNAGVAGALSVNVIDNTTKAYIEDADKDVDKAVVKAGNNVRIAARDDTSLAVMDGGVGFAILGGGVGGSVNVAVINKDTQAYVGDRAEVEALGNTPGANQSVYAGTDTKTRKNSQGLAVEAVSKENIANAVIAGGGAFVGVAGAVSANLVTANTATHIGSDAKVNAKDVHVAAVNEKQLFSATGSAGVGAGGLAGSVNVNIIQGNTTAYIDAAEVTASRDVALNALADKDITAGTVSAGGGVVGVAGSVSVLSVGGALTEENRQYLHTNGDAAGDIDSKAKTDQLEQMIGGYEYEAENGKKITAWASEKISQQTGKISVSDAVNKQPLPSGTTAAIREGANITAGGDVALNARDKLTLTAATGSVAGGAGAVGAAVTVLALDNDTSATIGDTAEIAAQGKLAVQAKWQQNTTADSVAGAGGGFGALGAAVTIVNDDSDVLASAGSGAKLTAKGIDYQAASTNTINAQAINLAVGQGLSLGASVADVNLEGSTQAYIGTGSSVISTGNSAVNVAATTRNTAAAKAQGGTAGFAGLGATVALVTDASGTDAYLGDNASLEGGAVTITSDYDGDVNAEAIVLAGGFVGAGASVAAAEITGANQAYTGKNSKIGQPAAVSSLQITADNTAKAKANAIAGAAGAGAGAGAMATAAVNPDSKAFIDNGAQINTAGKLIVQATGAGTADADASGLSVGGLAVGASVAKAVNTSKLTAGIGADTVLNVGGDLLVKARQTVDSDAKAIAAGGGLIGVNATVAIADSGAQVNSYIGDNGTATVSGKADIEAGAETKQKATASAAAVGYYAAGTSVAEAKSETSTTAAASGNLTADSVGIKATGTDDNFADATAGSGGVMSGAAAVVKTVANGSTQAALASGAKLNANTLAINASHTTRFNAAADSTSASVLGASGIRVDHTIDTTVNTNIGQGAIVSTQGDTSLKAASTAIKDWQGTGSGDKADWNIKAAGGGVASGAAVDIDINVNQQAGVKVGDNAKITAGQKGTRGDFAADAETAVTVREKAKINTGGAIALADVDSRVNANGKANVEFAGGAAVTSDTGAIKAGTKNSADLDNRVAADAYGLAGAPAGTAHSLFNGENNVKVSAGAKLTADQDIFLAAGRDTTGKAGAAAANAVVNLWNKTLVPINSKPDPKADIVSNSTLTIAGYAGSANDIDLIADKGAMNASYTGVGKDLYREALAEIGSAISELFDGEPINLDIRGGSKSVVGEGKVAINGRVETGLDRVKTLNFGGEYKQQQDGKWVWVLDPATVAGNGVTHTITNKVIAEAMTDRLNELYKLKAAYAGDTNAVEAYQAEITFLQNKMVSMGLAAWQGSVFVPGTSAGANALSPYEAAKANVTALGGQKTEIEGLYSDQAVLVGTVETIRDKATEEAGKLTQRDTALAAIPEGEILTGGIAAYRAAKDNTVTYTEATRDRYAAYVAAYDAYVPVQGQTDAAVNGLPAGDVYADLKTQYSDAASLSDFAVCADIVYGDQDAIKTELETQKGFFTDAIAIWQASIDLTDTNPGAANALSKTPPTGPTADYITVKPVTARLGDIRVSADKLTGTGELNAPGDAKIEITNDSPAFLTVQDLIVRDGGSIYFNGASVKDNTGINALNSDKVGAAFSQITTKSNSANPVITVKSTFNPNDSQNKRPFNGVNVPINIAPDITLAQNSVISNKNGTVTVKSAVGSIYANGSINAGTVDIEAANGDFVQTYVDGFTHVGGDPEEIYEDRNNPEDVKPGGITANGNIFISARYLNVNGLIQSGIADWTLILDDPSAMTVSYNGTSISLAQAQTQYQSDPTKRYYTVKSGYSGNIGDKGYVTYDAAEDRFEVGSVEVHGGLVQLHGQIINTANNEAGTGTGKVRALDGYGTISITNNSGKDIVLQNLDTGDGSAGVIDITDTAKGVQTVYKSDRGVVTKTETNLQTQVSTQNMVDADNDRDSFVYNPKGNLYYNWTTGKDYSKTTYYHYESEDVFGYTYDSGTAPKGSPTYTNYGVERPLENGIYLSSGRPFAGSGGYYAQDTRTVDTGVDVYNKIREWTERYWYTLGIAGTYYQDYSITTPKKDITTYSVNASNPIGIEFFGHNEGSINISGNNSNVWLNGAITNKEGVTSLSTDKDLRQANDTYLITTGSLQLSAGGNIGTPDQAVRAIIGDTLIASAASGSVNISQVLGDLKLGAVTADNGTLRLTADGNIVNASVSDVRGQRIELTSNNGGIGTGAKPLVVKTGRTDEYLNSAYGLKAVALDDINIENTSWDKNTAGDLLIDTVESRTGDVALKTPGQMIDNNTDEQIDERTWDELTSYWDSLQLRAGEAATEQKQAREAENFVNSKTTDYHTYWQLAERIADGRYVFADGEEAALSSQGIDTAGFAAERVARYQDLREQGVDAWSGGAYDAGFRYVISDAEKDSILKGSSWTDRELAISLSPGALKELTDTNPIVKAPNVKGKNITLDAGKGIGSNLDKIDIDVTKTPDQLTAAEKVALAAAERADLTVDDANKIISVTQRKAVNVEASGYLTADARDGFAYLGSESGVNLNYIRATGDVRLKTADAIDTADDLTGNRHVIIGSNIILESANGGIGTASTPLNLGQSGTLTARAEGDIHLTQDDTNGDMKVDTIYSRGEVSLRADGSIVSSDDNAEDELNIKSKNLQLKAGNAIGAAGKTLHVALEREGTLSAEAQQDINLRHSGDKLTVTDITSHTGDIALKASHDLAVRQATAANSVMLEATDGSLQATGVTATTGGITAAAVTDLTADTLTAGAAIHATAGGSLTAEILNAGGDIDLTAQTGDLDVQNATAANSVTLEATTGSLQANAVTATSGGITAAAGANLTADTLTAGAAISATAGNNLTADGLTAGGDINLIAQSGLLDAKNATAANSVTLEATAGNLRANAVTATTGSLSATAGTDLTANTLTAGADISATAGSLTAESLNAGGDISLTAQSSTLEVDNANAGNNVILEAVSAALEATNVTATSGGITATAGANLTANTLTAANSVTLEATTGSLQANAVTATSGGITAAAGTDLTADTLTAGEDIHATAGGNLMAESLNAAGDIDLTAQTGDLSVRNATVANNVMLEATTGSLQANSITSTSGSITAAAGTDLTADALTAGAAISATAGDNLTAETLDAGGDIRLTAQKGTLNANNVATGNNVILEAIGSALEANNVTATTGSIAAAAGTGLTATTLTAGEDISITAGTNLTANSLAAVNIDLTAQTGTLNVKNVTAANNVVLEAVANASEATNVTATTGSIVAMAGTGLTAGSLTAGTDIGLTAGSDINLTGSVVTDGTDNVNLTAGGAISQTAAGSITTGTLVTDSGAGQTLDSVNRIVRFDAVNRDSGDIVFRNANGFTAGNVDQQGSGNIRLGSDAGDIAVDTVTAINGKAVIDAYGSIVNAQAPLAAGEAPLANVTATDIDLLARTGGIGVADHRFYIDSSAADNISGSLRAEAAQNIYLSEVKGDLNNAAVISNSGDIDLMALDGKAGLTEIRAAGSTTLGGKDGVKADRIESDSLSFSQPPGTTLEFDTLVIRDSLTINADSVSIGRIKHTGSEPLVINLQGSKDSVGNPTQAADVRLHIQSDSGVILQGLNADNVRITTNTNNLSLNNARVGHGDIIAGGRNIVLDDTSVRPVDSNSSLQLLGDGAAFNLRMGADRNFITDAVVVYYHPDYLINGEFGHENSVTRQNEQGLARVDGTGVSGLAGAAGELPQPGMPGSDGLAGVVPTQFDGAVVNLDDTNDDDAENKE